MSYLIDPITGILVRRAAAAATVVTAITYPVMPRSVQVSSAGNLSIESSTGLRIGVGQSQLSTINKSISIIAGGRMEIHANAGLNVGN